MPWEAYRKQADAIGKIAAGGEADDSISYSSEGAERKHPESVVMLLASWPQKHGRHTRPLPVAGWLRGSVFVTNQLKTSGSSTVHISVQIC